MKNNYILLVALLFSMTLNAQIIDIPDANFKTALVSQNVAQLLGSSTYQDVDTNNDGEISIAEAAVVRYLNVNNRSISSLEGLQYFTDLREILFNNNQVTSFDSNGINTLAWVEGNNNQLTFIGLRDGYSPGFWDYYEYLARYEFYNNPVEFICKDSGDDILYDGGATFTSYCSFTPGGEYYTINGKTLFDGNNDGCDESDIATPYLMYSISDSSSDGNVVSNNSGAYNFYVGEDTYTFSPILENPSYFNVSPENQTVSFPSDTSPFEQDFCVTPTGTFNNMEISVFPIGIARPGFDADYKIVYKNKGTTTLSGSIDLTFQDAIMDLVFSNPSEDIQTTNTLTWNFSDLEPFESRGINFSMNINSPTETPSVASGDILVFEASINSTETDETPDDNSFSLNQTVVNSFDPNDKTCLEGDIISPEHVGEYLHYRIRFENTGTANAINVVVKDNIDRTRFDLSTMVPIDASHDFYARIVETTTKYYVEFIFENINLPFDDANNDGYIVFKIKTLDSLVLNDIIENNARIYFDFNSAIVTNVAETTVATLSTEDIRVDDTGVVLFPNPTENNIHLRSRQAIESISIYDISGRRIQDLLNQGSKTEMSISTEALQAGTYFVTIKTNDSTTVKSFTKK